MLYSSLALSFTLSFAHAHRTRSLRLENFHILASAHESLEHEKLQKCAENVANYMTRGN